MKQDKLFKKREKRNRYSLKKVTKNPIRLSVNRTGKHMYAQVIDDSKGITLASSSTLQKDVLGDVKSGSVVSAASNVGSEIAKRCKEAGITEVVFDRGGYKYHGRVKAVADAAREAGLKI